MILTKKGLLKGGLLSAVMVSCLAIYPVNAAITEEKITTTLNQEEGYNQEELTYLKDLFNQPYDNDITVGQKINDLASPERPIIYLEDDPTTWCGVTFNNLNRVIHLSFYKQCVGGDLDLSQFTQLTSIDGVLKEGSSLKVANMSDLYYIKISVDTLTISNCENVKISSLENIKKLTIKDYPTKTTLDIGFKNSTLLSEIAIINMPELKKLDLSPWNGQGNLNSLTLTGLDKLEDLDCSNWNLDLIDISSIPNLQDLNISSNGIKQLDLSKNKKLQTINASYCKLENLDLTNNKLLRYILLNDNKLETLLVSGTKLRWLDANNNNLKTIDLSHITSLGDEAFLNLSNNQLSAIDFPKNLKWSSVWVASNKLTSLDFRNIRYLESLSCSINPLKTIIGLEEVTDLFCMDVQLKEIKTHITNKSIWIQAIGNGVIGLNMYRTQERDGENYINYTLQAIPNEKSSFSKWNGKNFITQVASYNPDVSESVREMSISTVPGTFYCKAVFGGWKKNETGWWYEKDNATYYKNEWAKINQKWYSFNTAGYMRTGWFNEQGKWYYLDSSGMMRTGWVKVANRWYFHDSSGIMKTGWLKDGGKWYYLTSSGAMKIGWLKDGGKWYYLTSSGTMKTGWLKDGGKWYYLISSGTMKTGWLDENGKKYYLASNGQMLTGTHRIGGVRYKFASNGAKR